MAVMKSYHEFRAAALATVAGLAIAAGIGSAATPPPAPPPQAAQAALVATAATSPVNVVPGDVSGVAPR